MCNWVLKNMESGYDGYSFVCNIVNSHYMGCF
jgi:hypothetical protein